MDSLDTRARELLTLAPRDFLPGTFDALDRIPAPVAQEMRKVLSSLFESSFLTAAKSKLSNAKIYSSLELSPSVIAHHAQISCLSAARWVSNAPWHLCDDATVRTVANALAGGSDIMGSLDLILSSDPPPCRLYVAAVESDDRDSYLRSAAALAKKHRALKLVLDAELVEIGSGDDFPEAMRITGIGALYLGAAERSKAGRHSDLNPDLIRDKFPVVVVDSQGRRLSLSDTGAVQYPAAKASPTVPASPPAATRSSDAAEPVGRAPTQGLQSPPVDIKARIQSLRQTQSKRSAARP